MWHVGVACPGSEFPKVGNYGANPQPSLSAHTYIIILTRTRDEYINAGTAGGEYLTSTRHYRSHCYC